jgi:UDP-N-acetylglucosamine 2-epimerase (non-hydrolysing)
MDQKKILLVFGTRPEAIKMIPVFFELKSRNVLFDVKICVTAQHRNMLDQVLDFFQVIPDFDLDLMKPNQNLYQITSDIIVNMKKILEDYLPDLVLVHGDTTTSMAVSIAAFYNRCIIGHIEAGLRTFNRYSPFPEEMNRTITGRLSNFHFAPTELAKENLLKEGVKEEDIIVTGNTVIDALLFSLHKIKSETKLFKSIVELEKVISFDRDLILVTGHRRENFGEGFVNICNALKRIAESISNVQIIYPVHLNPNVKEPVSKILGHINNIVLIEPQPYEAFVWLMNKSKMIITDSGGVQEEAPSLGKPVLVMRDTTERPEAVTAGTVILVGTDSNKIYEEAKVLLEDSGKYDEMSTRHNPYGDGKASKRIVDFITKNIYNE